jgi:hypothetical protein
VELRGAGAGSTRPRRLSERQRGGRVARKVDERLHEEERADRDDDRGPDGGVEQ